jgi:NADH-quinone oxidoreductase subunit L
VGAYGVAVFHLMTHAFFKALLFLGSGSVIHGVEHGMHHTHAEGLDPQNMMNMGGLRKRMPVTFWTFLIGGFALSGFPLVTAGFWSKDAILGGAWEGGYVVVFVVLALSAFLTAFYTMRQISLTFLGQPRTKAAEHASESDPIFRTILFALVVLAFFAITAGWAGIPESFPGLGGLLPNWFHEFVGGTLLERPEAEAFNIVPLATSLVVALGGLLLGWLTYRNVPAGAAARDPLEAPLGPIHTLLKNKYYFDEMYAFAFVRPAVWLSETFVSTWVDRGVIDGTLHLVARTAIPIGNAFRNYFDAPVVNGSGDLVGNSVKWFGRTFRVIQTGKVQQYLLVVMVIMLVLGAVLFVPGLGR